MGRLARTLLRRVGQTAIVAILVASACFVAMQALPGDPALYAAAARYGDGHVTAANTAILRRESGLDRPIAVQYAAWMVELASGNLGRSFRTGEPVLDELLPRLRVTLTVGGWAGAVAVLLALPLGILAGRRPGGAVDRSVAALAALLASVPSFVAGTLLVALLAVHLRWLPAAGAGSLADLVLPAFTLALALLPGLARIVRHAVAGVAGAPYAIFARMRGVPAWRIALQVLARPAVIPIVSYLPVLAMQLIEGFITIELVFNLDGVGTLLVRSLLGRDLPVVMAAGIAFVLLLAAANALTDLFLYLLDPSLRAATR